MHQASLRGVDALRGTDLGEGEHRIDDRIGRLEDQVLLERRNTGTALGQFVINGEFDGRRIGGSPAEKDAESNRSSRSEQQRVALQFGGNFVTAGNTPLFRRAERGACCRDLDPGGPFAPVGQFVTLATGGGIDRREKRPPQGKTSVAAATPVALDREAAVEADTANAFLLQIAAVDGDLRNGVPGETPHERGVRIVGNRTQHRPNDIAVEAEAAIRSNPVTEHNRHAQAAHLDMIVMRIALGDLPFDGRAIGSDNVPSRGRTLVLTDGGKGDAANDGGKEKAKFFHHFQVYSESGAGTATANGVKLAKKSLRAKHCNAIPGRSAPQPIGLRRNGTAIAKPVFNTGLKY